MQTMTSTPPNQPATHSPSDPDQPDEPDYLGVPKLIPVHSIIEAEEHLLFNGLAGDEEIVITGNRIEDVMEDADAAPDADETVWELEVDPHAEATEEAGRSTDEPDEEEEEGLAEAVAGVWHSIAEVMEDIQSSNEWVYTRGELGLPPMCSECGHDAPSRLCQMSDPPVCVSCLEDANGGGHDAE